MQDIVEAAKQAAIAIFQLWKNPTDPEAQELLNKILSPDVLDQVREHARELQKQGIHFEVKRVEVTTDGNTVNVTVELEETTGGTTTNTTYELRFEVDGDTIRRVTVTQNGGSLEHHHHHH
uniref:De novo Beta Sheet Design Protein OR664 n=1 Tax=synthetic construct TaxID=32630 RepID=UPI00084CE66D|nr:Chain A, De novo Beta Sheet Design Protein OR664 [synthetic construct]